MYKTRPTKKKLDQAIALFIEGKDWEEICRELEISWSHKSKYKGMSIPDIKRFQELEEEYANLKKAYVALLADFLILKSTVGNPGVKEESHEIQVPACSFF